MSFYITYSTTTEFHLSVCIVHGLLNNSIKSKTRPIALNPNTQVNVYIQNVYIGQYTLYRYVHICVPASGAKLR